MELIRGTTLKGIIHVLVQVHHYKSWVWEMASNWSGDEVDDVQEMSEGKDDEMDGGTCYVVLWACLRLWVCPWFPMATFEVVRHLFCGFWAWFP